jgi:hypothetical protein
MPIHTEHAELLQTVVVEDSRSGIAVAAHAPLCAIAMRKSRSVCRQGSVQDHGRRILPLEIGA